jgi:transposase-like protein
MHRVQPGAIDRRDHLRPGVERGFLLPPVLFASGKDGISALSLQRTLEIGSYQTEWAMLHRLRSVMVRPGRDRLSGTVEVDETFIGGGEPGAARRPRPGQEGPDRHRCRGPRAKGDRSVPDGAADRCVRRLAACLRHDHVEPSSTVIADAWQGYRGLDKLGYVHDRRSQRDAHARGEDSGTLLPAVHRVAALIKRWLLGTHQGSTEATHLPSYMNKFVFRFNRRRSRSRGLLFYRVLELAASHTPVRYQDLIATKRHRKHHERHHRPADIRRVWSVPQRTGRGGPPDLHSSGYMDSTER